MADSVPSWMIPLVTAVVGGVIGGVGGYRLKSYELRTGEQTARIDDCIIEIEKIESLAIEYWKTNPPDAVRETGREIVSRLHRLNRFIGYCADKDWQFGEKSIGSAYIRFKQAVTGGAFESQDREPKPQSVGHIYDSATDLVLELRQVRRSVL